MAVRNKLPVGAASAAPVANGPGASSPGASGAGLGLVSLAERVALAGGTLTHGPDGSGDFVLTAALRWED